MEITLGRFVAVLALVLSVVLFVGVGASAVFEAYSRIGRDLERSSDEPDEPEWIPHTATGYSHGCACDRIIRRPWGTRCIHSKRRRPAANGEWPKVGTVAASREFPFGTVLEIKFREDDELTFRRVVTDRGSAITEGRLDIFEAGCKAAAEWGPGVPVLVRVAE